VQSIGNTSFGLGQPAEAVTMAAEVNAGERRGVDAVHWGTNGGVVELHGVERSLAEGLSGCGRA
jgi:hypothetical protein